MSPMRKTRKKKAVRTSTLVLALLIVGALATLQWQLAGGSAKPPASREQVQSTDGQRASTPSDASASARESVPAGGPSDSRQSSASQSPGSTGPAAAETSDQEFDALVKEGLSSLAPPDQLRAAVLADPHGIPRPLIQSGLALGRIAEAVTKNPSLAPRAKEFYSDCATSSEIAQSIRALCLARFQLHAGEDALPHGGSGIPASVVRLAGHVRFN